VRPLVAPLLGGFATAFGVGDDPLVEYQAELAFDGRPVLPQISVPVLLVARDRDVTSRGTGRKDRTADPRLHADLVRALGHIGHASAAALPAVDAALSAVSKSPSWAARMLPGSTSHLDDPTDREAAGLRALAVGICLSSRYWHRLAW
jgi:hypothetical protein